MAEDEHIAATRPSPDALLESANREMRGRLKIFLGAAPGVGKTFEMLMAGRARRADGVDVVIGVVETHGRKDTQALVDGFEIIPRASVEYKGHRLDEMDIDAILQRRPSLVLVDELAHTNAAGSRHPKRYLDVLEILSQGIDVYTTLNIQHVESLNDVVAQITRVRVRETVPDTIIDRADDVEVIDLTPDDLIKRLREGKIYLPNTAKQAIENYFSPGNLTALRELALRRTAQRVDEQLLNHMQSHAISGPWPAGERVLVCIDEKPRSAALIRYAKRQADRMRGQWMALYVETSHSATLSDAERDRLAAHLRLAEQLGGEASIVPGHSISQDIVRTAAAGNYTHIVIGISTRPRWRELVFGSIPHDLIREAGDISVHVISTHEADSTAVPQNVKTVAETQRLSPQPYIVATALVGVALGGGILLDQLLNVQNLALVFLMAVLTSAITSGLGPALYACVLSAFAFNYFFLEPRYTFAIRDPESVFALGFFLVIAVTASNLTARVQRQATAARQRAKATEDLYLFSRKLAGTGTLDDVLWATVFQIASMLKVRVVLLLPENGSIAVRAGYPPDDTLADADIAAARWAWEHNRAAGRGADTLPGAKRLYMPLKTGRTAIGVIGLDNDKTGPLLTPEQQRLLDALADQAAVAIERTQLVADVEGAKRMAETDRLRTALLTSISHDLKTPLSGILGAAGTLKEYDAKLNDADRMELVSTIQDEAERLNRFIANLLDMTRLESGAIHPNYALLDVGEVVGTALRRARKITAEHKLDVEVQADLPMVRLDPVLFEQALFNILDNASKYAPHESTIVIRGWRDSGTVLLRISDEGPGIPEDDLQRVFDTFYRVRKGDHVRAGTGLGLSICKGFVEAMGGSIAVENRRDRSGAVFTITMPAGQALAVGGDRP